MKTITFYSYKGGAGRTLLLVNTAYYLALAGRRVVMLDFDLEAPGLHHKFNLQVGTGIIDILLDWQKGVSYSLKGFDLRLMSPVSDVGGIPTAGKNLVVVADVKGVLHFRTFDAYGRVVVDTDDTSLTTQDGPIADLKKQLKDLWPPHRLTEGEKQRVITAVTSIVGHTRVKESLYEVTPETIKNVGGMLCLIPAGAAPSLYYATMLEELDWWRLSRGNKNGVIPSEEGVKALKNALESLDPEADYLLVDARTGITDVGTLALYRLADTVVCLFTNTPESVQGSALIMKNLSRHFELENLVPVLSRVPQQPLVGEFLNQFLNWMCSEINAAVPPPHDDRDSYFQLQPKDVVVIRSDPSLQIEERPLVASKQTIRESPIILDYLQFFDRLKLPKSIFSDDDRKLLKLYKDYPVSMEPTPTAIRRNTMRDVQKHGLVYNQATVKIYDYNKFVHNVVEQLCKICNTANVLGFPLLNEDFDITALRMFDGLLHFSSDPYFLTPARGQLVNVLLLGRVKFFGCAATPIIPVLRSKSSVDFEKDVLNFLTQQGSDYHISLLGETASSREVLPHLVQKCNIGRIHIAPSKSELEERWGIAKKNSQRLIVIADIDILQSGNIIKEDSQPPLFIPFKRYLPAGFACPLGDYWWRSAIAMAVAMVLESAPNEIWKKVSDALSMVGIEPLCGDELLRELLLDMDHKQAIHWQRQLRGLLSEVDPIL